MVIHRIVNLVFNSCTYVIHGEESRQAIIVDCGDVEPITDYLTEHGLVLSHILLTHSHFDHIYGLNVIIQVPFGKNYHQRVRLGRSAQSETEPLSLPRRL